MGKPVSAAIWSTLWSAIDADGGPTPEQESLLGAVGAHVLGIGPVEPEPLGPARAAAAITAPELRRLVGEGLVILELVRRPASAARAGAVVERVVLLVECKLGISE